MLRSFRSGWLATSSAGLASASGLLSQDLLALRPAAPLPVQVYEVTGQILELVRVQVQLLNWACRQLLTDWKFVTVSNVRLVPGVASSTRSTKVLLVQADDGKVVGEATAPHPEGTE